MRGSRRRQPKKNKYQQSVQDTLDLHGLYQVEAEEAVIGFLNDARARHYHLVRIITGKGIHSENGCGVLNDLVRRLLTERGHHFHAAKINEGGEGALDISLD